MIMDFLKKCSTFFLLSAFLTSCMQVDLAKENEINGQVIKADIVYTLGSGDLLKITIFSQEDMSGEYLVNGNGDISLPLIGRIKVMGLTLPEVETHLKAKLSPDYLLNPRVSLQVMNFRPYYILGEVAEPKSYPYVDGMTYINAVAIAGGYTYRAKKGYVYVIRGNDSDRNELKLSTTQKVLPGDTIRVDERFF